MNEWVVIGFVLGYLSLLFIVAYLTERLDKRGINIGNNPIVYALSLGVYCTAWTFYGSVGRASISGIEFLTIYLGPTISAPIWYYLLKKIIVICHSQRINSIADFISSRYGKNTFLGGLVAFIAVIGIIPYISLQLKAISLSFDVLVEESSYLYSTLDSKYFYQDSTFYVTILLTAFSIMFGARHLEVQRKHPGLVAVIAFESLIKLIAFISVGIFVCFHLFEGPSAIFSEAYKNPAWQHLFHLEQNISIYWRWAWLIIISMLAIFLLPRQFHIAVVENYQNKHVDSAIWIFPLYLLLINLFVLPIALGGLLYFQGSPQDADSYVLALPMAEGYDWLALLVFCGGFSAATSMVILSTISLSIMAGNNILIPILLRMSNIEEMDESDIFGRLIHIRRLIIVIILFLSYIYYLSIGKTNSLVTTGLFSFVAVAQFAPSVVGGVFWKEGNVWGATLGLMVGFMVWMYTLPIPALAQAGFFDANFIKEGLGGSSLLRPYALLGLEGLDHISHSAFWSLLFNSAIYFGVSLYTRVSILANNQAELFVNIEKYVRTEGNFPTSRAKAYVADLHILLKRFIGAKRAEDLLSEYAQEKSLTLSQLKEADSDLINHVEKWLAGALGAASASLLIHSVVRATSVSLLEVMHMMDETQQILQYSQELEQKSIALTRVTEELKKANQKLQEMDELKNDFIGTITHELRTPITSIQSLASIINQTDQLDRDKRREFLDIIIQESKRVSRLINRVLDLEKMESGHADIQLNPIYLPKLLHQTLNRFEPVCQTNGIQLYRDIGETQQTISGDKDRLTQVFVNLLSNAIKFCHPSVGKIWVSSSENATHQIIKIRDNGNGIPKEQQAYIFDKFTQFNHRKVRLRPGSGLGLSISWRIINIHGGTLKVDSEEGEGATFIISLPQQKNTSPPLAT